jgi:site-specific DNA-methyltransferase (adenine-specific)
MEGEDSPQNVIPINGVDGDDKFHIAEKPVGLLAKLIGVTPVGATVLDPFMGSGTTGVACIQTGRRFIGMEIDPAYHAIAERRIAVEKERFPLFDRPAPTAQPDLFDANANPEDAP